MVSGRLVNGVGAFSLRGGAGDEQTGRGWRIHSWRVASRQQRDGVRVGRVGMCRALRKLLSPRESSELAARWREGKGGSHV